MTRVAPAQPDVTLFLDIGGVIRDARVSHLLAGESVEGWLGRPWGETVPDLAGEKVRRIVADARDTGISAFRQITQRFPSGREVPMEYTTVLLGGGSGLMSVGKSLHAVAELQSRLVEAQQTMERDYWRMREVETRYRLLFDTSSEAVLVLRPGSFRIAEANPAAVEALGLTDADGAMGQDVLAAVAAAERAPLRAMVQQVRQDGKAPGTLVHLGDDRVPWLIRAAPVKSAAGASVMLRLVSTDPRFGMIPAETIPRVDDFVRKLPDGFVVLDQSGVVRLANQAFADMVDMSAVGLVTGEKLSRWVWRPGADVAALLETLRAHGVVRLFGSALHGDLETETEVEISGATLSHGGTSFHGLTIRNVGRRLRGQGSPLSIASLVGTMTEPVGKMPLREFVKTAVDGVERHFVRAALDLARGNRTVASEILGLSRQSLYTKLERYGLDEDAERGTEQGNGSSGGP